MQRLDPNPRRLTARRARVPAIRLAPDAKLEPVTARRDSLSSHSRATWQQTLTHRGMRGLWVDFGSRCMFRVGAEAGLATVSPTARPRFSRMIRRFP
jgi:hypothetical protein